MSSLHLFILQKGITTVDVSSENICPQTCVWQANANLGEVLGSEFVQDSQQVGRGILNSSPACWFYPENAPTCFLPSSTHTCTPLWRNQQKNDQEGMFRGEKLLSWWFPPNNSLPTLPLWSRLWVGNRRSSLQCVMLSLLRTIDASADSLTDSAFEKFSTERLSSPFAIFCHTLFPSPHPKVQGMQILQGEKPLDF